MIQFIRRLRDFDRGSGERHPLTVPLIATAVFVLAGATAAVATSGGDGDDESPEFWRTLAAIAQERHRDLTGCYLPVPDGKPQTVVCYPKPVVTPTPGGTVTTPVRTGGPSGSPTSGGPTSGSPGGDGSSAGVAHGWSSGASGKGVLDGTFGSWRGSPVTIVATWSDTEENVQANLTSLGELSGWNGDVDIAIGGTILGTGENYQQAAAGAYLSRWTQQARKLQEARGDKAGLTYVRPFHEFNGEWYSNWQATPANVSDYKASFRLMAQTIRQHCPAKCKVVWSPNSGTSRGSAPVADAYPGDDVVDVIGVDSYNANGAVVADSPQAWVQHRDAGTAADPVGPEMWRQFAQARGKPIAFPEWGLRHESGGGDNADYVKGMHEFMSTHAAKPGEANLAGKVVYDCYFNVEHGNSAQFLIMEGPNPQAGAAYQNLTWGNAAFLTR